METSNISNENLFKKDYQKVLYNFVKEIKELKQISNDPKNPVNYISNYGQCQHTVTYFSKYVTFRKNTNSDSNVILKFNDTHLLLRLLYVAMVPKYNKNGDMKWMYPIKMKDRLDTDDHITQYSCPQTFDFYENCKDMSIEELSKLNVSRYPLTQKDIHDNESSPYQKVNWNYLKYIIDLIGSNYIPDVCDKIISEMETITPDRAVDIFHCQSIEYAYFIRWLSSSNMSSNMNQVRKIWDATRKNITFIPKYIVDQKGNNNLASLSTKGLFNMSSVNKNVTIVDEDGTKSSIERKTIIQVDFTKYCRYYIDIANKHTLEPIPDDFDEKEFTRILNSHEDILMENELYKQNSDFIKYIISKGKSVIIDSIFRNMIESESLQGMIEKIQPLMSPIMNYMK